MCHSESYHRSAIGLTVQPRRAPLPMIAGIGTTNWPVGLKAGQIIGDVRADAICRVTRFSSKYRARTNGAGKDGFDITVRVGHVPVLVEGIRLDISEACLRWAADIRSGDPNWKKSGPCGKATSMLPAHESPHRPRQNRSQLRPKR